MDINNANAAPPYTTWASAATTIQEAIDLADIGDQIWVTNGIYETGGRAIYGLTNRIALTKAITVQSVNGPAVTIIKGYQIPSSTNGASAVRCAYLTNGSALTGFTLQGGATGTAVGATDGGGIWCESTNAFITNCVLVSNSANVSGGGTYKGTLVNCMLTNNAALFGSGGGSSGSILKRCILLGNVALSSGGGAYGGNLENCIVIGNRAQNGGGMYDGSARNCTIISNTASTSGGGFYSVTPTAVPINCIMYYNNASAGSSGDSYGPFATNCCVLNASVERSSNFTNAPVFVNLAGGDYRLAATSPCINSGLNQYAAAELDFDGNPRVVNGLVDVGAFEYQSPGSTLPYAWLLNHGLSLDGSVDHFDSDGDGHDNWQEWVSSTDPTNSSSVFRMITVTNAAVGLKISWWSESGPRYFVERSTNLGTSGFEVIATNLSGPGPVFPRTYTDSTAIGEGPFFYRVGIQP
ncbi:MAG: choice-of-anchor Q domain-containing protein [Verrucomicrobiota bacterium]